MTNELKDKFQQLVADPPPSSGVPSDAVFSRIRTARRRRTVGVAVLAAAATVAVVAVAAVSATGLNSTPPPVVGTTGVPTTIATGSPTTSTPTSPPTSESPTTKPTNTTSTTSNTSPNPPTNTNKPEPPSNKNTSTPVIKPVKLTFTLHPTMKGMTVTMRFTTSGSLLIPVIERTGKSLPSDMAFQDLSYMTGYTWGDGSPGAGANAGLLTCKGANKRVTGQGTDQARDPHTYAKAGSYTFTSTVWYCGPSGIEKVTKTTELTVK
jgi:hypothetical protein